MPVPSNASLHPQATTVTFENAHTGAAIQLAIDLIMQPQNHHHRTVSSQEPLSKPNQEIRISIRRVAAMHKIPFSQLQRAIDAGGELQTRSEAHEAEMVLKIAEETAFGIWCLAMYRLGSLVRLDVLRRTAVAILEDREQLNIESAPDFLTEFWILNSEASARV